MGTDMTVPCGEGYLNIRVGAIIRKDGKLLMVGNDREDYYYSVGGRIQFGESAEQAVVREVLEETGCRMEIDRLGFVHEDYFYADSPDKLGKTVYELSFYFYMKVPEDFRPVCGSVTADNDREYLRWVSPEESRTIFPAFFRTELDKPAPGVRHIFTDER